MRRRFFALPNRAARGQLMTRLGFDKFQIWAALDTLSFDVEGKTYTFSSWIDDEERRRDGTVIPFSTIIASARELGADDVHASIRLQLLEVQGTLRSVAGGAARPGHFQPSGPSSDPQFRARQLEFDPVEESNEQHDSHPLNVDADGLVDPSGGPDAQTELSNPLALSDDVFESERSQELRSDFLGDGQQPDRGQDRLEYGQPWESQGFAQRSDLTSEKRDLDGLNRGTSEISEQSVSSSHEVSSSLAASVVSPETSSHTPGDINLGFLNPIRAGLDNGLRQEIDQKTSIPVNWSSETVDLYDGAYGDITLKFSIDGSLNPSIERDGKSEYSLSLENSDLDFNLTLGLEGTYTKEIPRYDLELSATLGTSIMLTLEKNPGEQGISSYNISSSGLQLEMIAGLIVNPEYNGAFLSASIDPELSWTIDFSLQDGIDVGRPSFDLNFEYSFDKPDSWKAMTEIFENVGEEFVEFFENPSWSNFVDSVNSLLNLGEFLTSPKFVSWVVTEVSAYVSDVMNEVSAYAEDLVNDAFADIHSAAKSISSAVSEAADAASDWASDAWDSASDWTSDAWDDVTSW
ncbi:hypothetical protein EV13_0378 [Prochlorococcus sp. MIT 0702]|nr:hypothetical protein EV13_0378 [Prochlorococcus sp. MIT 0702]KGG35775.1 hypothetical protein EV14_0783 [Prochlorococcus sp. MIT 0703]